MGEDKHKFAFFLGAGCSISSGIPGSKELVSRWLESYYQEETGCNPDSEDPEYLNWLNYNFPGYTYENGADYYRPVIEKLYPNTEERKAAFAKLIEGKDPAFGYGVLAQLVGNSDYGEYCNIILTTNFDDLIADAFYLYSYKKPLVVSHGSLAGFVRLTDRIPIILKLHGDVMFEIENTEDETNEIDKRFRDRLNEILREMGIIFIGYGGNDIGILKILTELSQEHLQNGIYWINNELPNSDEFTDWLSAREAIWVKTDNFDKLMLILFQKFELFHPDCYRCNRVLDNYYETAKKMKGELKSDKEIAAYVEVLKSTKMIKGTIWEIWSQANKIEKRDPKAARRIYEEGLRKFQSDAVLSSLYGIFLKNIIKDYDNAEKYFKKALALGPTNAKVNSDYAAFLSTVRKDYDNAEKYFKKALALDPTNAEVNSDYAEFLSTVRKDYDNAEKYFKKALALDPTNAEVNGNYAEFLSTVRKDYDNAEKYFKKALALDLDKAEINGNYAEFLSTVRKDYDNAEKYFKKALDLGPSNAKVNDNYAVFLNTLRKNYYKAEKYFKKALELEPENAGVIGNYAGFLLARGNKSDGKRYINRVFELIATNDDPPLRLECLFYCYAHFFDDEKMCGDSFKQMESLLDQGICSPGWDFGANIERATFEGHPFPARLGELSKKISKPSGHLS